MTRERYRPLAKTGLAALAALSLMIPSAPAARATDESAFAAAKHRCGTFRARSLRYRYAIVGGKPSCVTARRVLRYVLTHGKPEQGSPGRSPAGWICGYGYGRAANGDSVRAGPNCQRGRAMVEAIDIRVHPYF